jgi:hypothetical protein
MLFRVEAFGVVFGARVYQIAGRKGNLPWRIWYNHPARRTEAVSDWQLAIERGNLTP